MKTRSTLEHLPLESLVPYARNSRTHSAEQVAQVAASIREFGFTNPVLIDADGGIIAGHGRVMAARQLGLAEVPCIRLAHLSEAQRRAYVIADNKLALNAGWDEKMLALEFADLRALEYDTTLTGFSLDDIDELLAELDATPEGETDADETPAVQAAVKTQPGDVWLLGKHRVMCGDSTRIDQAQELLGGGMADMVFTDPPYNVAYEGRGDNDLGPIKNDNMDDAQFEQFLRDVFTAYWSVMKALAPIYVCHPDSATAPKLAFEKTFAERFKKSSTIIWAKQSAGMGWQDYRAQHEPILYGWKEGAAHLWAASRRKAAAGSRAWSSSTTTATAARRPARPVWPASPSSWTTATPFAPTTSGASASPSLPPARAPSPCAAKPCRCPGPRWTTARSGWMCACAKRPSC